MLPKPKWLSLLLILFLASCVAAQHPKSHPTHTGAPPATAPVDPKLAAAAKPFVTTGCDANLWKHVYHPQRLQVIENCISVTGTIHHVKKEADGDDHIQLMLDPEFAGLLNDKNTSVQAGSLVIEPICQGPVTQPDAVTACRDFHSAVDVPAKGTRVRVVGSYVLDTEPDHGWTEIHPVTSIAPAQ